MASPAPKAKTIAVKPLNICDQCGMAFKKLEHLQRHTRTRALTFTPDSSDYLLMTDADTQDRPYSCTAPGCNKAFARQDTLNRHAKLHLRDESEGGKVRSRKRTKSVSDSSASKRSTASPYAAPHGQPSSRTSDNSRAPIFTSGFAYPSPALTDAPLPPTSLGPSSSRFSTLDLLGLTYPIDINASPSSAYGALPSLSEICPSALTPASSSICPPDPFKNFSPLSHSLYLPPSPMTCPPSLDAEAAPSPFFSSDDGSSNGTSDPSSLGAASFTSSFATSVDSRPDVRAAQKPRSMSKASQAIDDIRLGSLFQAADLPINIFSWPATSKPQQPTRSAPTSQGFMQQSCQQKFNSWLSSYTGCTAPAFTTMPSYPPTNPTPLAPEEQDFDWWQSESTGSGSADGSGSAAASTNSNVNESTQMHDQLQLPVLANSLGLDFDAYLADPSLA